MNFAGIHMATIVPSEKKRKMRTCPNQTVLAVNDIQDPFTNSHAHFQNLGPNYCTLY